MSKAYKLIRFTRRRISILIQIILGILIIILFVHFALIVLFDRPYILSDLLAKIGLLLLMTYWLLPPLYKNLSEEYWSTRGGMGKGKKRSIDDELGKSLFSEDVK